jgi:hypothetical protein
MKIILNKSIRCLPEIDNIYGIFKLIPFFNFHFVKTKTNEIIRVKGNCLHSDFLTTTCSKIMITVKSRNPNVN